MEKLLWLTLSLLASPIASEFVYLPNSTKEAQGYSVDFSSNLNFELDNIFQAKKYTIDPNETIGLLEQPIQIKSHSSLSFNGDLVSFTLKEAGVNEKLLNGKGYFVDSTNDIYASMDPIILSDSAIYQPHFELMNSLSPSADSSFENFNCPGLSVAKDAVFFGCQYTNPKTSEGFFKLFSFSSDLSQLYSEKTLPIFAQNPRISFAKTDSSEFLKGNLFVLVENEYLMVLNVENSSKPQPATVIDNTTIQEFKPARIQFFEESIVALSPNGNSSMISIITLEPNYEVAFRNIEIKEELLSQEFSVNGDDAFFLTEEGVLRLNLNQLSNSSKLEINSSGKVSLKICASSKFVHVMGIDKTSGDFVVASLVNGDHLWDYSSAVYKLESNLSDFWFQVDEFKEIIYVVVGNQMLIYQVGRPQFQIEAKKDQKPFWINAVYSQNELKSNQYEVRFVNSYSELKYEFPFGSPLLNVTTFTGGAFSLILDYSNIIYGIDLNYTVDNTSSTDSKVLVPKSKPWIIEGLDPVLFNTAQDRSLTLMAKNSPDNLKIPTECIGIFLNTSLKAQANLRVFGCSQGIGSSSFLCIARFNAKLNISQVVSMHPLSDGMIMEDQKGNYHLLRYFEEEPLYQFSGLCGVSQMRLLICGNNDTINIYRVSGKSASNTPINTFSRSPYNSIFCINGIMTSQLAAGFMTISDICLKQVLIYDMGDPNHPKLVGVIPISSNFFNVTMLTPQNIFIETWTNKTAQKLFEVYEITSGIASQPVFAKVYSFGDSKGLMMPFVRFSSEKSSTLFVQFKSEEGETIWGIRAGFNVIRASNPVFKLPVSYSFLVNTGGLDFVFGSDPSGSELKPLGIQYEPSITFNPEIMDLDKEVFEMQVQINITNQASKTESITYQANLVNSGTNFTISREELDSVEFNDTLGGLFNIFDSGLFDRKAVFFYYMTASNMDDIGTQIHFSNPIEPVYGYSFLADSNRSKNIIGLKRAPNENYSMIQNLKGFSIIDPNNSQVVHTVDFAVSVKVSVKCIAGSYSNGKAASICKDNFLRAYLLLFENETQLACIQINELTNAQISDVLIIGDMVVIQADHSAIFYSLSQSPSSNLWTVSLIKSLENAKNIHYNDTENYTMFFLTANTGSVFQVYFNKKAKELKAGKSFVTVFETLAEHGFSHFSNTDNIQVFGQVCEVYNNEGTPHSLNKAHCVIASTVGDVDIVFTLNSTNMAFAMQFNGLYMPYATAVSAGQFLLTKNFYLSIVHRETKWVPGTPEPSSRYDLLVYERLEVNSTGTSVRFNITDARYILAGVPGSAFFVDDHEFLPTLADVSVAFDPKTFGEDFEGFVVASNQFNKLLLFNITGEAFVRYDNDKEIKSKDFGLVAFNSFQSVFAEIKGKTHAPSFWFYILLSNAITILLIGLVIIGFWLFPLFHKGALDDEDGLTDSSDEENPEEFRVSQKNL